MNDLIKIKESKDNVITSLELKTTKEKKALYNAMNNADFALSDYVGKTIVLKDYIAHNVIVEDKDGNDIEVVRFVLIDKDGHSYATVSNGVTQAFTKIFSIFGQPNEWDDEMKIQVLEKKSSKDSKNKYITIELV